MLTRTRKRGISLTGIVMSCAALIFAGLSLGGCSQSNPVESSSETNVDALCEFFPEGDFMGRQGHAIVIGPPDLHITVNGTELPYNGALGQFDGEIPYVAGGDTVDLCVVDGADELHLYDIVPDAPTDLSLYGGHWDCSSASVVNVLNWSRLTEYYDDTCVHVCVRDTLDQLEPIFRQCLLDTDQSQLAIVNCQLSHFADLSQVDCLVFQYDASGENTPWGATEHHLVTLFTRAVCWRAWPAVHGSPD
jgi:hypothetical protein